MKRVSLVLAAACVVVIAGCSNGKLSLPLAVSAKKEPSILGKWKGKLEMPKADKEDPMAGMGEAMANMFAGSITLEFKENDKFSLSMMGMPMEGSYERSGSSMTLTAETAMGMPISEIKKKDSSLKQEKMEATISEDGTKITLKDKGGKAENGTMVFVRMDEEPEKKRESTVKSSESGLVGSYGAEIEGDPGKMSDKDKQEYEMAKMMIASTSLDLRADNTFKLNLMFEMEGTWKESGGKIVLHMTKMLGMPEGGTSKSDDMVLETRPDGRLVVEEKGPGGVKLVFAKK